MRDGADQPAKGSLCACWNSGVEEGGAHNFKFFGVAALPQQPWRIHPGLF